MNSSHAATLGTAMMLVLSITACDEASPEQLPTAPGATWSSSDGNRLSGQVLDVSPGGQVPVVGIPLTIVVVGPSNCAVAPCVSATTLSRVPTMSGPDGRYAVDHLPGGSAVVLTHSLTHRQVCGAGVNLIGNMPLNVHVTSKTNPYSLPMMTPLEISGQVYETNSAGRLAIDGATVGMQHHGPDAPFFDVVTDSRGFYRACGIPPGWPIALSVGKPGYQSRYVWNTFSGNSRVDIELTPEQ
jgi:hypothetical protein